VSGLTSAGKRRLAVWAAAIGVVIANWFIPGGFWWCLGGLLVFVLLNLGWDARSDWARLRRDSFFFADFTTAQIQPGDRRRYYSPVVMRRDYPPRLLWAVIVNDHSTRIYMGWCLWSREPPGYEKAVSRGVRRKQIA
jgi:hypothetical protein